MDRSPLARWLPAALVLTLFAAPLQLHGGEHCALGEADATKAKTCCVTGQQENWRKHLESAYGVTIKGMFWQTVNTNSANPVNPAGGVGGLPGGLFLYRSDEYMLNWLGARIERNTGTDDRCWDAGGVVHLVYGTDYFTLQSRGLEQRRNGTNHWNSNSGAGLIGGLHGVAVPELYGELAYCDLSLKLGKTFHPLGFSRYGPNENRIANTRSYAALYGEFATITGLFADWQANDQWTFSGAVHRGNNNWEDNNDHLNAYLGFHWKSCDERCELRYMFDVGREDAAALNDQFIHGLVFQMRLDEQWTYLVHHNLGWVENVAPGGGDARWHGLEQHLTRQVNEQLVAGLRYEWFDDADGVRVAQTPGPGAYHLISLGGTYFIKKHIWFRPELRWGVV